MLWCAELNSFVINEEVTFDESLVFLNRSDCGSVYTDMDGV